MPRISIVDRGARDYQNWLQPESPDHLTPRSLSSELVLTHEWQPGHHVLETRLAHFHAQFTSVGAGWCVPQQVCPAPATGWIRYILAASIVQPNPAASRVFVLGIATGAPGMGNLGIVASVYSTQACFLARPMVIPVGYDLWGAWNAAGAGEVCELDSLYVDYRCCEPLPRL